jgi:hypothetical protein
VLCLYKTLYLISKVCPSRQGVKLSNPLFVRASLEGCEAGEGRARGRRSGGGGSEAGALSGVSEGQLEEEGGEEEEDGVRAAGWKGQVVLGEVQGAAQAREAFSEGGVGAGGRGEARRALPRPPVSQLPALQPMTPEQEAGAGHTSPSTTHGAAHGKGSRIPRPPARSMGA